MHSSLAPRHNEFYSPRNALDPVVQRDMKPEEVWAERWNTMGRNNLGL